MIERHKIARGWESFSGPSQTGCLRRSPHGWVHDAAESPEGDGDPEKLSQPRAIDREKLGIHFKRRPQLYTFSNRCSRSQELITRRKVSYSVSFTAV